MRTYLAVYLGSTILAIIATAMVIYIARRLQLVDIPGIRKVHSKPIPRIGGVAIVISMVGLVVPVLLLPNVIGETFRLLQSKIFTILGAAGFIFLIGLIDDVRGVRVRTKLLAQLAAGLIVCAAGIRIESIPVADQLTLKLGWFSWVFTLAWIIGITNIILTLFNPAWLVRNSLFQYVR